jgi:hypothetical protein
MAARLDIETSVLAAFLILGAGCALETADLESSVLHIEQSSVTSTSSSTAATRANARWLELSETELSQADSALTALRRMLRERPADRSDADIRTVEEFYNKVVEERARDDLNREVGTWYAGLDTTARAGVPANTALRVRYYLRHSTSWNRLRELVADAVALSTQTTISDASLFFAGYYHYLRVRRWSYAQLLGRPPDTGEVGRDLADLVANNWRTFSNGAYTTLGISPPYLDR